MSEVNSSKSLLKAIQDGERFIKITNPNFLLACMIAYECNNVKRNVKNYLNVILGSENQVVTQDNPPVNIGLVDEKEKVRWMTITLSNCASALAIMDILNATQSKILVKENYRGYLTSKAEIVPEL